MPLEITTAKCVFFFSDIQLGIHDYHRLLCNTLHPMPSSLSCPDHFKEVHLVISRSYVENNSVRSFLTIVQWCEKATNGGAKLFSKIELIGSYRVCGGIMGLLTK